MAKARAITGLDPHASVATNARLIAKARLADMYQWESFVDNPFNVRELHDMRIAAKRLRYTLEVFEEALPAASKGIVDELTQLQDELGALHDNDVMIALLRTCLAQQDSEIGAESTKDSRKRKNLVPVEMMAHLLNPSAAPTAEDRYGLEEFLQKQERLRVHNYTAFRQRWYKLQARDFRREILDMLGA